MSDQHTLVTFSVFCDEDVDALRTTLQSIVESTGRPGEVNSGGFVHQINVFFEAAPTEKWHELTNTCAEFGARFLVHEQQSGVNMVEQALRHAHSEFFWPLLAGTVIFPNAIYRMIDALAKQPYHIGAYLRAMRLDEDGYLVDGRRWPEPAAAPSGDVLTDLLQGKEFLHVGNVLLRTHTLWKVRLPVGLNGGRDWLLFCRLALHGHFVFAGDYQACAIRSPHFQKDDAHFAPPVPEHMLDMVFTDKRFIETLGKDTLATYRKQCRTPLPPAPQAEKDPYTALELLQTRFRETEFKGGGLLRATPLHDIPERKKDGRIRILHVIKFFYAGGCERLLRSILENTDTERFEHIVLSLSDQKERISDITEKLGVPYYTVDMPYSLHLSHHVHCFYMMERIAPDIVKTWLHPSNVSGGVLGYMLKKPVVWGIHNYHSADAEDRLEYELSHHIPHRIICCSHPIRDAAEAHGYNPALLDVIENGTDAEQFQHSPEGRAQLRKEWGVDDDTILIGMAAEYQPLKRHRYFLRAAKELTRAHKNVRFLLCGKRVDDETRHLQDLLSSLGLKEYVITAGVRNDMPETYSAMDIHTLCPENEPFGLAVIESMACEAYPVTMSVIPEIVRGIGTTLEFSENPHVLANAWAEAIALPAEERRKRAKLGRKRIVEQYSIRETTRKYDAMFADVKKNTRPYKGGAT